MARGHKTGGRQKGTPNKATVRLAAKLAEAAERATYHRREGGALRPPKGPRARDLMRKVRLVPRVAHIAGYNLFSFARASAVVKCQSALTCFFVSAVLRGGDLLDQGQLVGDTPIEALT
jgi:hypothetical protein